MLGTKTKKIILYALLACTIALLCLTSFIIWLKTASAPVSHQKSEVYLSVKRGDSFVRILSELKKNGLARSEKAAKFLYWWNNYSLKAGYYQLGPHLSLNEILAILHGGKEHLTRVTIPEGSNIYEIPDILRERGFSQTADELSPLLFDRVYLSKNGIRLPSAEGYLFPSTYFLPRNISGEELFGTMLDTFREKTRELFQNLSAEDQEKALIMASIIEKEAVVAQERPLISSVFHNRLRLKMKLQADPTVRYASKNFNDPIRRSQLRLQSPYNTYFAPGLPPGPICNPGLSSIKAALSPESSDFLFFVSKYDGTGEHHFSRSNREHINFRRQNDQKLKEQNR